MKIADYEVHPAAKLFPMLPKDELRELAEDIKAHGLRNPIILCDKMILDGRNRLVACGMVGVGAYFRNYQGNQSPTEYVISTNIRRRHLTPSERAAIAVEALPLLEAEAELERRKKISESRSGEMVQKVAPSEKSRDKAAKLTGANRQYVSDAKRIKAKSPQLFMQVAEGEKTLTEAKRELGLKPKLPESGYYLSSLKHTWSKCTQTEKTTFLEWAKHNK